MFLYHVYCLLRCCKDPMEFDCFFSWSSQRFLGGFSFNHTTYSIIWTLSMHIHIICSFTSWVSTDLPWAKKWAYRRFYRPNGEGVAKLKMRDLVSKEQTRYFQLLRKKSSAWRGINRWRFFLRTIPQLSRMRCKHTTGINSWSQFIHG